MKSLSEETAIFKKFCFVHLLHNIAFIGIDNFIYQSKKSLMSLYKSLQSIKFGDVAEVTLEYIEKNSSEVEIFLHSLDVVNEVGKKIKTNIKFIFDEFQDITKISEKEILEQLRSVAQHHENITYIFLGSIESMMTRIFESKLSPFFHFARVMPLSGLDIDEVYKYVYMQFDNRNISYDKKSIKKILDFLQGHPDYSMQTFQSIFYRSILEDSEVNMELCIEVLKEVILENRAYLEELIQKAKSKKHLYEILCSIANDTSVDIPSKSLYSAHVTLEDMGLIRNISRGKYEIIDVFLRVFLQQNDKNMLVGKNSLNIELK